MSIFRRPKSAISKHWERNPGYIKNNVFSTINVLYLCPQFVCYFFGSCGFCNFVRNYRRGVNNLTQYCGPTLDTKRCNKKTITGATYLCTIIKTVLFKKKTVDSWYSVTSRYSRIWLGNSSNFRAVQALIGGHTALEYSKGGGRLDLGILHIRRYKNTHILNKWNSRK